MSSQMKNQNFRRNGLSDDYGDNRRPIHVQRGDDCGSSDAQSMNFSMSSHNPSTNMRNLGSYKTTNAGYPTQAVTCHRPVSSPYSPPFYMPTSRSAHIGDNVASLLQNSLHCSQKNEKNGGCVQSGNSEYSNIQSQYMLDSGYYGNNRQEPTFSMGNYRAGDGKQFMGIMDNIEIPETTQLDDDSYSDNGQLYYYDAETSKLCPIDPQEYQNLVTTNDGGNERNGSVGQSESDQLNNNAMETMNSSEQETMQTESSMEKYDEISKVNEVSGEN